MNKKEAIEWANHFPTNENLWYFVVKHNDGYIVHSSSHLKFYPLNKEIIYSTKDKDGK